MFAGVQYTFTCIIEQPGSIEEFPWISAFMNGRQFEGFTQDGRSLEVTFQATSIIEELTCEFQFVPAGAPHFTLTASLLKEKDFAVLLQQITG